MRAIIIGGGVVGYSLAEQLLKDKHELSLIEADPELCQQLSEKLDLQILNGSGTSSNLLKQAGLEHADMIIAVTPNNETNLLVCAFAAQFGVKQRIARLRGKEYDSDHSFIDLEKLGITSLIQPEKVMAEHIMQYVETPHAKDTANFENGRILMRAYQVTKDMEITGKTPKEIRTMIDPFVVLFSAIIRDGVGMIPDGDTRIEAGDLVYSLFPRESLERFLKLMAIETKNRKIIMTGDSYATIELARTFDKTDYHVTYVDPNKDHAEKAAAEFNNVEVLNGDCTSIELLRELNIDKASFFISVSDEVDYNMLSAVLAKNEGAHEVITSTTELHHNQLFHSIGIDHIINPRLTTAREILETISKGHIGNKVKLSNVDIEAIRFLVNSDSDIAGMKVKKIASKLKKGTIIGIIIREDRIIIPDGETTLEIDDHIIMITHNKNLPFLSKLFKPHKLFRRS
ncbi:MAG: Trk system potassium transporter TrkA [candidate division Zixibacteria bacterium]|nr:Trk system potassium transporter TrkA [candidate division Zixibacteria bacterium]